MEHEDSIQPQYDFSGGVRGKHHKAYVTGHSVRIKKMDGTVERQHFAPEEDTVQLDPDVRQYFPDSKSVNEALRSLIRLIPKKA